VLDDRDDNHRYPNYHLHHDRESNRHHH